MAVHLRPLGQLVALPHDRELGGRDEVEVPAVPLPRARGPRRVRHRVVEIGHEGAHLVAQRRLARPRRGRDDHEGPAPLDQLHYSRFCTCSRSFSRVDLAAITARDISRSSALAPTVFTSRLISWIRKSSVRPTAPPWSSRALSWSRGGPAPAPAPR